MYKLDLFERPADHAASTLERYLQRIRVESGKALETARQEYRSRARKTQARATIPEAWVELVLKGDELLVDLVAGAVESKTGIRPEDDDVAEFLVGLARPVTAQPTRPTALPQSPPIIFTPRTNPPRIPEPARSGRLMLRGQSYPYNNAKEAMVILLRELAKADPQFLDRCSQHPHAQGRKRRYIARTAEELYPDRPDLREHQESLPGGWLVATNLNNVLKKTIIRLAAEVAGLEFGKDVTVDF